MSKAQAKALLLATMVGTLGTLPYGLENRPRRSGNTEFKTTDHIDKGAVIAPYKKKDKLTRRERKRGKRKWKDTLD